MGKRANENLVQLKKDLLSLASEARLFTLGTGKSRLQRRHCWLNSCAAVVEGKTYAGNSLSFYHYKTFHLAGQDIHLAGQIAQEFKMCINNCIWKIKKVLYSAHFQMIQVALFGIVLFCLDIGTDVAFTLNLLRIKSSRGDIAYFFKEILPWLSLSMIAIPGIFMALTSLSRGRLDLFCSDNLWINLTWLTSPLILPYLIIMPVWALFVPLLR